MKTITSKLSKQEKKILEILLNNISLMNDESMKVKTRTISYYVAKDFNQYDGDRIKFVSKEELERQRKEHEEEQAKIEEELKEQAAQGDELAKQTLVFRQYFQKKKRRRWLEDKEYLTEKHRASFSRSLKRLEDRGLIRRVGGRVSLTDKGFRAIDRLQERELNKRRIPKKAVG